MVKDADSATEILRKMRSQDSSLSNECKLLIITAFLNVCLKEEMSEKDKKTLSKLHRGKPNEKGLVIFEQWKRDALETLNHLARQKDDDSWVKDVVARRLLLKYIKFIEKCYFVDSAARLDILKEKLNIDWNQPDYLNDVSNPCFC